MSCHTQLTAMAARSNPFPGHGSKIYRMVWRAKYHPLDLVLWNRRNVFPLTALGTFGALPELERKTTTKRVAFLRYAIVWVVNWYIGIW